MKFYMYNPIKVLFILKSLSRKFTQSARHLFVRRGCSSGHETSSPLVSFPGSTARLFFAHSKKLGSKAWEREKLTPTVGLHLIYG